MFGWLSRRKSAADVERALAGAIAHHDAGRLAQAEAAYREVLDAEPQHVDALHFLGFLAFQRAEHRRATELIARALALNPSNARAQHNLGNAHLALGEHERAAACFRQALELQPDFLEARYNLGIACRSLGRRDEAAACFAEAIRLQPQAAEAHYALGHLHADDDRVDEALRCFREALRLRPDYAEARWSIAMAQLPQVCQAADEPARRRSAFADELAGLERWFDDSRPAQGHAAVGAAQPFSLAYQEEPNRELLERHGRLCARLMTQWREAQGIPAARPRRRGAPLRVGVVSAQFHNHSVWHALAKGWFAELDRSRFALYAFHLGTARDAETEFAAQRSAHFEQGARDLRDWVEAIERQQPDVLLYPEIGMDPIALRLAALRLAPLQAASWGHPETTGLPTIDCYLSAEDLEPPGAQANYSEKLVMLPHLGGHFAPRDGGMARGDAPEVPGRGPLLVCPGVPFKYAPQHDWIFPEIAQRLGECRFAFFTHSALAQRLQQRLGAAFGARGLDAGRFVVFLPWLSNAAFQSLLGRADVYLDTIGFSGFNTALLAVQNGLPAVTREGRFLRGRLASGILKRLGLAELVAASEAGYVDRVEKLACDAAYRADVAARMAAARASLYGDRAPILALESFLAS